MKPFAVISFCDRTGNMVQPWLKAGHECWIVDIQHKPGVYRDGLLIRVGVDLRECVSSWLPTQQTFGRAFAFPACTNLAVSGARWFKGKGLRGLASGISLVERCVNLCEWLGVPYMLENPVGTLSTYWRKPDATFQPWEYAGYLPDIETDNTSKKTCLWTGGGICDSRQAAGPGATSHGLLGCPAIR